MKKQSTLSQEKSQLIVAAIRAGIEATKHHAKYTSRVVNAIKAEVVKALGAEGNPDSIVVSDAAVSSLGCFRIWGAGIAYEDSFYACWNLRNGNHWSDPILIELSRCDLADVIEREQQEVSLYPLFAQAQAEVMELQARIEAVTSTVSRAISELPIPQAATLRTSQCHWNSPTSKTAAKFPNLFSE